MGCVIESYDTCFGGREIQEEDPVWRAAHEGDIVWKIARSGIDHCYSKHRDRVSVASSLYGWYERHIKMP